MQLLSKYMDSVDSKQLLSRYMDSVVIACCSCLGIWIVWDSMQLHSRYMDSVG